MVCPGGNDPTPTGATRFAASNRVVERNGSTTRGTDGCHDRPAEAGARPQGRPIPRNRHPHARTAPMGDQLPLPVPQKERSQRRSSATDRRSPSKRSSIAESRLRSGPSAEGFSRGRGPCPLGRPACRGKRGPSYPTLTRLPTGPAAAKEQRNQRQAQRRAGGGEAPWQSARRSQPPPTWGVGSLGRYGRWPRGAGNPGRSSGDDE
jgi:hypothetical protein